MSWANAAVPSFVAGGRFVRADRVAWSRLGGLNLRGSPGDRQNLVARFVEIAWRQDRLFELCSLPVRHISEFELRVAASFAHATSAWAIAVPTGTFASGQSGAARLLAVFAVRVVALLAL